MFEQEKEVMTHASVEQSEALRLAKWLEHRSMSGVKPNDLAASAELRRLHARVQELEVERTAIIAEKDEYKVWYRVARAELEASQARAPLSYEYIRDIYAEESHWDIVAPYVIEFARAIESAHGITQEKQV